MPIRCCPRLRAFALLALSVIACSAGDPPVNFGALSPQDSAATEREVRASLGGDRSRGDQTYTFRGFQAGMTRAAFESAVGPGDPPQCMASTTNPHEQSCEYARTFPADDAAVTVTATFAGSATPRAREIVVIRKLPLTVDGIVMVRELASAFERQTRWLDHRDASYGRHEATVRLGQTGGERSNSVTLHVQPLQGRDQLTVTLTRGAPEARPPVRQHASASHSALPH